MSVLCLHPLVFLSSFTGRVQWSFRLVHLSHCRFKPAFLWAFLSPVPWLPSPIMTPPCYLSYHTASPSSSAKCVLYWSFQCIRLGPEPRMRKLPTELHPEGRKEGEIQDEPLSNPAADFLRLTRQHHGFQVPVTKVWHSLNPLSSVQGRLETFQVTNCMCSLDQQMPNFCIKKKTDLNQQACR